MQPKLPDTYDAWRTASPPDDDEPTFRQTILDRDPEYPDDEDFFSRC
jgi:hypothetical protein